MPQIVEAGIGHEDHAIEERSQGQRAAEQIDQTSGFALGCKQICNRCAQQEQNGRHANVRK